jgi:hypothetical protein
MAGDRVDSNICARAFGQFAATARCGNARTDID